MLQVYQDTIQYEANQAKSGQVHMSAVVGRLGYATAYFLKFEMEPIALVHFSAHTVKRDSNMATKGCALSLSFCSVPQILHVFVISESSVRPFKFRRPINSPVFLRPLTSSFSFDGGALHESC